MPSAPRIHHPGPLAIGAHLALPEQAVRHVQVLRMQPGQAITLFPGDDAESGREYAATITEMGRHSVQVRIDACEVHTRENPIALHLTVGMPGNERMDWLVEKATELGAASITPLMTERSVLRLQGERAEKKRAHWQAIAIAACEQCGRNRVPLIHPVSTLAAYVQAQAQEQAQAAGGAQRRCVLSLHAGSARLDARWLAELEQGGVNALTVLSGPEGGLSQAEEKQALAAGFAPLHLGPRVLRAETAPLAVAAALGLLGTAP
ncbi:MAG: 16S rRNA (uracil(1498)-N(3))-methyltransferase [Comamonadaceae bacterium]|nr:16S rRNA (uracil(1498)-N(3))-methyltransferase [Comamonadaceae bacterium]